MKFFKIEIQVTLLTLIIAAAVIGSGYLVYQSLSQIVNSIHQEARPDFKLLLIKEIASDLTEAENTIRLYTLTNNESLTADYRELNNSIQGKIEDLKDYAVPQSEEIATIDSIQLLTNHKLLILDQIQTLFQNRENTNNSFSDLLSKIDTTIIPSDTITFEPEESPTFLQRINPFRKRDTATVREPIIIDNTAEIESLKEEISNIEQQITDENAQFQAAEKLLLEQNIQVTNRINKQISSLDENEQRRLVTKTEEADFMAAQTYRRLAMFTIAAVLLLILVLFIFFRNLQRNRSYQRILQKAKQDAESLAKAKEGFVATVSHEMRTPVNAIYGLSEQMLQKEKNEEIKKNLNVVHQSARHLITLVNDTLDFSKIESQQMKIDSVDFYPNQVLNEVYILHEQPSADKGIKLVINNRSADDLVLKGDPIRLKQILINLVTNAIKFTNQGYVIINVEGEQPAPDKYLLKFEVSDTGVGIPTENLQNVFDEFVQLENNRNQKFRGAGLGLAIVKKLVDLQKGKIEVKSVPGKGSTFSVQIPYSLGNKENIKEEQEVSLDTPDWFKNLRFLLVDDEEFNLYMLKAILKKWGVSYLEAHDGKEAIELGGQKEFSLILMDVRMPEIDGYEATRQILKLKPKAKIVALSATQNEEDIRKFKEAGMVEFLQKPFSESELLKLVVGLIKPKKVNQNKTRSDSPIDMDELKRLAGGDNRFLIEMLELFVNSSKKNMESIHDGLKNNDIKLISEAAHKLAAPARHMMAMHLYQLLKELETKPKEKTTVNELKALVKSIEIEVSHINNFIRKKLSKL